MRRIVGLTVVTALAFGLVPDALAAGALQEPGDDWVERLGGWAYVVAPLVMVVVAIVPFPAEVPAAANGMIFGPILGTVITWGGAVIGAVVSFELSRRVGTPLGQRFAGAAVMDRADRIVQSAGWPGLLLVRLIPTVAFTAINWAAGVTRLRRWRFFWTTAIGILPGAVVFTVSGSGLAAVYRLNPLLALSLGVLAAGVLWWAVARYRDRSWDHTTEFAAVASGAESPGPARSSGGTLTGRVPPEGTPR